jgi:hypothetical protein
MTLLKFKNSDIEHAVHGAINHFTYYDKTEEDKLQFCLNLLEALRYSIGDVQMSLDDFVIIKGFM